ncbi:hypothetical protein I5677_01130 [Mobilitalea sibirica]|uniref:Alpha glucuronidase N-terminal domain-containing protein n=1 Tax=Mobilitalea sibirica TaxID=1462919 RepID=A0A8J7KVS1_9FIRM|nr:hypothetical protein [Mobilitalea sibirica]MBH1939492.1 hypothetical protein [Mobilitalea sibirica]
MINIISNVELTPAIQFALDKLKQELMYRSAENNTFHLRLFMDRKLKPQGYQRLTTQDTVTITGADEAGVMYGVLDLSKEISHGKGMEDISDISVIPYLEYRGIKFNIPLDARTPSYSDASDSASLNIENMWDFEFWKEFLDRMALNRYNVLSLWSLSPFPSLVRIPEYPLTALEDVKITTRPIKADLSGWGMYTKDMKESLVTVKKMTMDDKISFWQSVMEYAKNRCIKIFIFTWNLFVYGTENNPYGITCDQHNPVTKDYIYCGTKALMETYPLLAGIGITSGEHMLRDETDIPFLADSYGRGVKDYLADHPQREFRFIHRMQYTAYDSIIEEFREFPCPFGISFKYSQAHMYSSTKPAFIHDFLKEKAKDLKIWLTIRNDDFYMYRWGDPEFAREYIKNLPSDEMTGFYMGADGYTWGRDYMDERDLSHPLYIKKMWYMFTIWGQLSYNMDLSKDYFIHELNSYFKIEASKLYDSWKHASSILQEFNQVHWHDYDFQWYPEGCCMYDFETDKLVFADINEFIRCKSIPGGDYYSVSEYCEAMYRGEPLSKIDPLRTAETILSYAEQALEGVNLIRQKAEGNQELQYTLDDIETLSYLGRYYATKLKAAVLLCTYRKNGDKKLQQEAVELLKTAANLWKIYSSKSRAMYKPQVLTRLCSYVDVKRFDRLAELDVLLALEE